ncbi:hypothetical protein MRX96_027421 [Rhipicephalus microplus]
MSNELQPYGQAATPQRVTTSSLIQQSVRALVSAVRVNNSDRAEPSGWPLREHLRLLKSALSILTCHHWFRRTKQSRDALYHAGRGEMNRGVTTQSECETGANALVVFSLRQRVVLTKEARGNTKGNEKKKAMYVPK